VNILKKVEIKSKSTDFSKYMSLFNMKLETERKSIRDFMNCWPIPCTACKKETECDGPIDSTRASFVWRGSGHSLSRLRVFVSTLPSFMSFQFNDH